MQNQTKEGATPGDEELVIRAQQGDGAAFSELMLRHQARCSKLAFSILRDRRDAQDEVQNAFWKAYEHIGQFQRDSKFTTWLTRIVVNQCLIRLRQTKRARLVYIEDVTIGDEQTTLDLRDTRQGPDYELGRSEVAAVLQKEIRGIPPLLRSAYLLRDVQELPMQDVAERLGISVAAAKSRLLRARTELRTRLEKHMGRSGPATLMA